MRKLNNIAPLVVLVIILTMAIAPMAIHGQRLGYHALNIAKSLGLFSLGAWLAEYLKESLKRKHYIWIGSATAICFLQYLALEITYASGVEFSNIVHVAMIGRWIYYLSFVFVGIACSSMSMKPINKYSSCGLKALIHNTALAFIFLGLYLIMKILPEKVWFYNLSTEAFRIAIRTLAIFPWITTLICVNRCMKCEVFVSILAKWPRLTQGIISLFPASIFILLTMYHLESIKWWMDLIRYPIYVIILSISCRLVVSLVKALASKDFNWKYILIGIK